jgi:hypothetical protein
MSVGQGERDHRQLIEEVRIYQQQGVAPRRLR